MLNLEPQALLMIDASRLEEELEGAGGKSVVPLQVTSMDSTP
jgi:hypothetical protein